MLTQVTNNLCFLVETQKSDDESTQSRITAIQALAINLNRECGFKVDTHYAHDFTQDSEALSDDVIYVHWILDDGMLSTTRNLPEKKITILFSPFLPLITSPAIAVGYGENVRQQRSVAQFDHSNWVRKSMLMGELEDLSFRPLPQQFDKLFTQRGGKVILLGHATCECTEHLGNMVRNLLSEGHTILMPNSMKEKYQWIKNKKHRVKFLPHSIPEYIQVGILYRVHLFIGNQNALTYTAALIDTPCLPYPEETSTGMPIPKSMMTELEQGFLSEDLLDLARFYSQQLAHKLLSSLPLEPGMETEIGTFMRRILPFAHPDKGYLRTSDRILPNFPDASKQISLFPFDNTVHSTVTPMANRYQVRKDRLTRKVRKLKNDPETFLCDSKGMLTSWLCKILYRQRPSSDTNYK